MLVGYARVSTILQNEARQLEKLQSAKCEKIFIDKLSGVNTNRPQLKECLDFVRQGDTLIVHSIDRLARSHKDLFKILSAMQDKGVKVVFLKQNLTANETITQDMIINILGYVAQLEYEILHERQREGIEIAKRQGKYKGRKGKEYDSESIKKVLDKNYYNISKSARELKMSRETLYRVMRKLNIRKKGDKDV